MVNSTLLENESNEKLRKIGTIASGIGGAYTGGHLVGLYQSKKAESAEQDLRRLHGEKSPQYSGDRTGRHMLYTLGGAIPILGSFTNHKMRNKHYELVNEIEKLKKIKANKK